VRKRLSMTSMLGATVLSLMTLGLPALANTAAADPASDQQQAERTVADVVPAPVEAKANATANFWLSPATVIRTQPGSTSAKQVGDYLAGVLRPATGYPLPVISWDEFHLPSISLELGDAEQRVGKAGYQLEVTKAGVEIRANTADGLFSGVQTLRQLLPASIEAKTVQHQAWTISGGTILDYPRFEYRGAMIDIARHFHNLADLKTYVDEISQYKINYLHLHLTDDQGWRIQIDSWPNLTKIGGAPGTGVDGVGGGYLTKAQYIELVTYAQARRVTIVPEIDMPGHTNAAQHSYAELNCDGVAVPARTDIAVGYSSLCIDKDVTYKFVEDVIREVAAITPGPYIHIGGDEAHATTPENYKKFEDRVLPLVAKYGKKLAGWHEIATVNPPTTAVPQYWRSTPNGDAAVAAAAARGNKILLSPANKAYLDMKYNKDSPLGLRWAGFIEVKDAYDWNPATLIPGVSESSVLGVEAPLWSETLRKLADIEYMAFPRLTAIAELGWSTAASHNWDSYRTRLTKQGPRWTAQGVNFYRSTQVDWE
jgi:hexosaminidase